MSEMLTYTVNIDNETVKAGVYLRTVCKLSSRTLSVLKRTEGGLLRNGELLRTIDYLRNGDVVTINLPSETNTVVPVEGELEVLFEDSSLLIINKPPFMPVHPVKVHQLNTVANIVAYKYRNSKTDFVFRAINRLDKDTSGAVLIAKDRHTASLLQSVNIEKHYTAVCHGTINNAGTIDEPIGLLPDSKIVRCVTPSGKHAVTHYSPERVFANGTQLDIVLETGRTHQIRCHMSHLGHPLMGDDLYGGERSLINRQALHCISLCFTNPLSGKDVFVKAPLFDDMHNLIKELSRE